MPPKAAQREAWNRRPPSPAPPTRAAQSTVSESESGVQQHIIDISENRDGAAAHSHGSESREMSHAVGEKRDQQSVTNDQ
jgi:hypothetical protein